MQIKELFLKEQKETVSFYRKTIKKICFSINMQENAQ